MASDRSDHANGRGVAPPDGPPRDHILPQVTPREGWTGDWRPAIEELCAFVGARYPDANQHALRQRLAPLLTKTVEIVSVGKVEVVGRGEFVKPATFIRNTIMALRSKPPEEGVEALRNPEAVLRNYLDARLEAEDAEVDRPPDPALDSDQRAAQRYALVAAPDEDLLPQPRSGAENPWATVADLVADLLADVTGHEPKRVYDAVRGTDRGWPLAFFKLFATLAVSPDRLPRLDRVWRNALEARTKK